LKTFTTLLAVVVVGVLAAVGFAYSGLYDVSASSPHGGFVSWLLSTTSHASIERHASEIDVPDLADEALTLAGVSDFAGMCAGCHAWKTAERRLGPSLAGVFGRRAGTVPGYRYSRAMKESGVLWNATTLDAWLADPKKFLPGTRMPFSGIRSARDRSDLIVFLERRARQRRKN